MKLYPPYIEGIIPSFSLVSGMGTVITVPFSMNRAVSQNEISNFNSALYDNTMLQLQEKAYDNRIPLMAKCYFSEMAKVFDGLTIHLKDNANVLIDLGDSIFSNVHIKTDYILVEILKGN